jgi:hypothetical protein
MVFPYQKVKPADSKPTDPWVLLPLLKIRLSHSHETIQLDALIDSGANVSLFNVAVAQALGIDTEKGLKQEFFGISGDGIEAYFHTVRLQIVGAKDTIDLAVGFTHSPGVGALLGQADFFQHHRVKFERYKERIEIKPASK